jgi:hypothetical protein
VHIDKGTGQGFKHLDTWGVSRGRSHDNQRPSFFNVLALHSTRRGVLLPGAAGNLNPLIAHRPVTGAGTLRFVNLQGFIQVARSEQDFLQPGNPHGL